MDLALNRNDNGQLISVPDVATMLGQLLDGLDISPTTRKDYQLRTPLFIDFVKGSGLNRNTYLEYKRYLAGRVDLSLATKAKYLTVAKVILKELHRKGDLPDITSSIKGFKQTKKHKRDGINDDEMTKLMEAVKGLPNNLETARTRAILSLLTLQGLRQIEVSRLDVTDLDLVAGTALILGKGRDDKEVIYLHPETVRTLSDYLRLAKIKSGALFTSTSNNSRNQRLATRSIRGIVKELLATLGIDKTTHGFRHYFTTKLIKTYKGDLLEVAGYTRHRSLEMLQVYNDTVRKQADLPRYYSSFSGVGF